MESCALGVGCAGSWQAVQSPTAATWVSWGKVHSCGWEDTIATGAVTSPSPWHSRQDAPVGRSGALPSSPRWQVVHSSPASRWVACEKALAAVPAGAA